jgi:hypothetical protein
MVLARKRHSIRSRFDVIRQRKAETGGRLFTDRERVKRSQDSDTRFK